MSGELKKEFKTKDVQRMRNIITKNYGASTQIGVGYETKQIDYKEGDVWEEDGRTWTIKNGLKQTITKLDKIKKLVSLPFACPSCKKAMKDTPTNRKMWGIHGKCLDCVVKMEAQMKIDGTFLEYQKNILNTNKNSILNDLEASLDDWLNSSTGFVTEAGDVEDWGKKMGNDVEVQRVRDTIKELKSKDI